MQARVVRSVNDTIRALNWLAGAEHRGEPIMREKATQLKANQLQSEVLSRLNHLCGERELERTNINPKDAFNELLRGRGLYESEAAYATLATYRRGAVSLPSSVVKAPLVADTLPESARVFLVSLRSG